eukprot:13471-Heterococcus_DN1.PRE.1
MPFADKQALYMFMADYQRSTRRTGSPVMVGVPESLALGSVTAGELLLTCALVAAASSVDIHCREQWCKLRVQSIIALCSCATSTAAASAAATSRSSADNTNADQYCDTPLSPSAAATSALLPGPTSPFARASMLATSLRAGRRTLFSGGASLKPPPEPTVRAAVLSFDDLSGAVVQYCDDEQQQQQRIPVHSVPKLAMELASVMRQSDSPHTPWGL